MLALKKLLETEGVVAGKPATSEAIAQVAKSFDRDLPVELVNLWRTANGVTLEGIDAGILSCEQVIDFLGEAPVGWGLISQGILPLVDDHQSNYLAVSLDRPLAHRIVFLPHDDGPRLLFTTLESCLEALLTAMAEGETLDCFVHDTDGDYAPEARRSERDQEAARALMATDGKVHEWNFATQLLDETNLDEFARLLETDHFVRRDVRARMSSMQSLEIRKLLGRDRKVFAQFSSDLTAAAKAAGLRVEKAQTEQVLRIGGIYIELEGFFHERHQAEAMAKAVARIQELIALSAKRRG